SPVHGGGLGWGREPRGKGCIAADWLPSQPSPASGGRGQKHTSGGGVSLEVAPHQTPSPVHGGGLGRGRAPAQTPQSVVTRLISARLVTPFVTFSNADWRRSRTPDFSEAPAICKALPPSSTIVAISSVIGMT